MIADRYKDRIGNRFGSLYLVKICEERGNNNRFRGLFLCDCGIEIERDLSRVVNQGKPAHCGCMSDRGSGRRKHGMRDSVEYSTWVSIKDRCLNKNNKSYKRYGGKGITVDEEWIDSFEKFYEHIGPRPESATSIDRIDNEKGYVIGNVRWADNLTQQRNTSASYRWFIRGLEFESSSDAATHFGVSVQTIWRWVNGGYDSRDERTYGKREDCYAEKKY